MTCFWRCDMLQVTVQDGYIILLYLIWILWVIFYARYDAVDAAFLLSGLCGVGMPVDSWTWFKRPIHPVGQQVNCFWDAKALEFLFSRNWDKLGLGLCCVYHTIGTIIYLAATLGPWSEIAKPHCLVLSRHGRWFQWPWPWALASLLHSSGWSGWGNGWFLKLGYPLEFNIQ